MADSGAKQSMGSRLVLFRRCGGQSRAINHGLASFPKYGTKPSYNEPKAKKWELGKTPVRYRRVQPHAFFLGVSTSPAGRHRHPPRYVPSCCAFQARESTIIALFSLLLSLLSPSLSFFLTCLTPPSTSLLFSLPVDFSSPLLTTP